MAEYKFDEIVSHLQVSGYVYPGSQIYGGLSNKFDSRTLILITIASIIKESGYALEFDECVKCGSKKDIVSYSFLEGGFICIKCLKNHHEVKSPISLKTYRYIFKVGPEMMNHYELNIKVSTEMIISLCEYLKSCFALKEIKALEIYLRSID